VRAPIEAGSFLRVDLTGADGLYAFRTRVRRADSEGRIVLAKPDLIRRVQRRKHARAALHGDVEIRTRDGGTIRAKGRDVSVGGIGVLLDRPIAVGEVIDASWQLTSAASKVLPAQATAAVVRCDPVWDAEGYAVCRAGLQFTELPATLRRRISAYISRHG
jgi:c-di-GMP-binding flagellar brake protein YcgR